MKIISAIIEFCTEFFYYISEVYRRSRFRINHLFVYPVAFLYSEILLKILSHTQAHVAYMLVFDIGIMCLATGLTSLFKNKINRILTILVLTANGIYFGMECSFRQLDAIYEDIIPLFQSGDAPQAFLEALPLVLLFMIPAFIYLLLGAEHLPAVRRQPLFCGLLLLAFLIFTFMGSVVGAHGRYAPYYKSVDSFNESTEIFGLYTSTRLELKWRFIGDGPTYEQVRAQSKTPETDIGSRDEDTVLEDGEVSAQDEELVQSDAEESTADAADESANMTGNVEIEDSLDTAESAESEAGEDTTGEAAPENSAEG